MAYKGLVIRDAVKITTFYSFFCRHYENTYRFLGETHNFWECMLVRKGEISVTDTASKLGFSSQGYFSAAYKRETGLSPTEVINKRL